MQSQSIDFTNEFSQEYIPSGGPVLIEITRYFKSDGGKCDIVIRLKKSLCGQTKAAHLWYENLKNGLLDRGFVASKVDPCLFMYNIVICVVYVEGCIVWALSQSDIDNTMKYFKEGGPS